MHDNICGSITFFITLMFYGQGQGINTNIFSVFRCTVLGVFGSVLGEQFYKATHLAPSLLNSIFTNIDYLPNYKLKLLTHILFKDNYFILTYSHFILRSTILYYVQLFYVDVHLCNIEIQFKSTNSICCAHILRP